MKLPALRKINELVVSIFIVLFLFSALVVALFWLLSDDFFSLPISLSLLFVGTYLFLNALAARKKIRFFKNTATSKTRAVAMGPAELFGRVKACNGSAPYSNRPSGYCKTLIKQYLILGDHSILFRVRRRIFDATFHLQDDFGVVAVNSEGAHVDIPERWSRTYHYADFVKDRVPEMLKDENLFCSRFIKVEVLEYNVEPGDDLYVFGTATSNKADKLSKILIHKDKNLFYIGKHDESVQLDNTTFQMVLGFMLGPLFIFAGLLTVSTFFNIL